MRSQIKLCVGRLLISLLPVYSQGLLAQLPAGVDLPPLEVGERGELMLDPSGNVHYEPWSTARLTADRVILLMYLPGRPSSREQIRPLQHALEAEAFAAEALQVVSIVNLDDAVIGAGLLVGHELKQEKQRHPDAQFVVDSAGLGQTIWQLPRRRNAVLLLGRSGQLVHSHVGELGQADVEHILGLIHELLGNQGP